MLDKYNTIQNPSEGIYKEKGSKFLSFAFSVYSVEEAMSIVESYRKRFYDARHVCYAYSVGTDNPQTRVNDDGEPSGTAGRPIMGQIQSYGLNNILI
ncbi:MAG: YigZ family protein, partial [Bacteroidales bacterium]|nr:YigZ family protein [Bacteroidales bacterium]